MILKEYRIFVLIGLFFLSSFHVSAQSADEITDIRLSYEFLDPIDSSGELMENLDDAVALSEWFGDSVLVAVHFTATDLEGLQGMTFQIMEGSKNLTGEIYYAFEDYSSEYKSRLYRDNNYFSLKLGYHALSENMLVKVKLKYTDRETSYYSNL